MQILEKALNFFGLQKKGISNSTSNASGGDPFILAGGYKKIAKDKAMQVIEGWVYACIRAIAEELANMKFRLYEVKKDGTNEEIFDHELLDLLDGVNPLQSGYELKYITSAHLEAVGNSYWRLEGVKSETDKPSAIYMLDPVHVRIARAPSPTFVAGYKYTEKTKVTTYQPYEILHLKYPDPSDPIEGVGTVQSLAQWIDSDNYATEFNRRFFLNGAKIGGLLESENALTTVQIEQLRRSFENVYKGWENAYKVAILPKGTKYSEMGTSQKDMDFTNLQTMMRDKILAGFRVPKTVLGITEDVNRANAEATNYVFALRTIKPKMQLIVSYLNEFLVPRYGDNLYLDFASPVPEDRLLKIQELQAAMAGQPVISVNEAREEYFGLDGIKNGDTVMTDFSKVPLGKPEKQLSRETTKSKRYFRPRKAKHLKAKKDISNNIAKAAAEAIVALKDISQLTHEEYMPVWNKFVTRVTPYEKATAEALRKINAQQKEDVLKNLPSAIKSKAINAGDLYEYDQYVSLTVSAVTPVMLELMAKEGLAAAELIGISGMDILTPEVRKALQKAMELMSESYNTTTLNLLKEKLEQGLADGLSITELAEKVQEVYEFSDLSRAETVARTETFRVANTATREAWTQSGVVHSYKWYTASDPNVCEFCDAMEGKTVDSGDAFLDQGDRVIGTDGGMMRADYDTVENPPLHVNCRCYMRPDVIGIASAENQIEEKTEPTVPKISVEEEVRKQVGAFKDEIRDELMEELKKEIKDETNSIKEKIDEALQE